MPERPILLFSKVEPASKNDKPSGAPKIQTPSHSVQSSRMAPRLAVLDKALLAMQNSPTGIEAERTLVFEVAGNVDNFYTAIKNMGDQAEWIFDMPDDFLASDDFYAYKEDKKTKEQIRLENKTIIGGKVYCVLTNGQALSQMLTLWKKYSKDKKASFPRGKTSLRDVFDSLIDIHPWGYKERLEETGILEYWKEDLEDTSLPFVRCELELFFHRLEDKQKRCEQVIKAEIENLGGIFITSSIISEIKYHAVLASLPRNVVENMINGNRDISIINAEEVMYIRHFGQSVYIPKSNTFDSEDIVVPLAQDIIDEPIIALFDGLPQENHPYLAGRLIIDDPDDYSPQYVVQSRRHGTSMASIIVHGDLGNIRHQAARKIYVRPIMKPIDWHNDDTREQIPDDVLLVDKIHIAVRRLFEEEAGRVAPSIKVVNLSIGNQYRQFDKLMSPLARLLDWLSYRYRILFIVSAGNHSNNIDIGMTFLDFSRLSLQERDKVMFTYLRNNSRLSRLLSPAESINALTVGAIYEDNADFTENTRWILPCSDGMLSPISSFGKGMNNGIKPDIVYIGGRKFVVEKTPPFDSTVVRWSDAPTRAPGIVSAAPTDVAGGSDKVMYSFGTSDATAMLTHEVERCYDVLLDVFQSAQKDMPDDYTALLIKAMLIHGSEWGDLGEYLSNIAGWNKREPSDELYRYIGYGKPNIDRAIECAKNRITLIGYGELSNGEAEVYSLPLPFDFSSNKLCRRLTVTLTFFPPISPSRQYYRCADVWFTVKENKEKLLNERIDTDWQAVTRGSVQHEIFENDNTLVWEDDGVFKVKVNCRAIANETLDEKIPYALMVSFEIKNDLDIDVYAKVAEKVSPPIITPIP